MNELGALITTIAVLDLEMAEPEVKAVWLEDALCD